MLLLLLLLKRARIGKQATSIRVAPYTTSPVGNVDRMLESTGTFINLLRVADGLVELGNVPSLLIHLLLEFLSHFAKFQLIKQAWSESHGWTLILTHPPIRPVKCKWSHAIHSGTEQSGSRDVNVRAITLVTAIRSTYL